MQYVSGGTISSLLRGFGPFTERQAVLYVRQILQGLSYLHNQRIAHRDLKGDNLLVDPDGTLKLADFGTAKELMTKTSRSIAGTAFFMAPEVITGVGHGCEADVWSLGCCVIEMLTGKPPFSQFENHYAIMVQVAELSDTNFLIPSGFSSSCTDFLRQCLRKVAQERGTCAQLLQHPWISESRPEPHIGELTVTFTPAAAAAAAAAAVATRAAKSAPERAPPDVSEGPGPSLDSFNPMPPE
jgi:serine/threonine protein kinase